MDITYTANNRLEAGKYSLIVFSGCEGKQMQEHPTKSAKQKSVSLNQTKPPMYSRLFYPQEAGVHRGWTVSVPGSPWARGSVAALARTGSQAGASTGPTEPDGRKDGAAAPGTTSPLTSRHTHTHTRCFFVYMIFETSTKLNSQRPRVTSFTFRLTLLQIISHFILCPLLHSLPDMPRTHTQTHTWLCSDYCLNFMQQVCDITHKIEDPVALQFIPPCDKCLKKK